MPTKLPQIEKDFKMKNKLSKKNEQQLPLANVINWVAVSEQTPPEGEWVITGHNIDKWVDRASYHGGTWENGECDIYPTHWAFVEPPCL